MTCLLDWSRPAAGRIHFDSLARAFRVAGHELIGVIPGHGGGEPFDRMVKVPIYRDDMVGQALLSVAHLHHLIQTLRREKPHLLYYRFRSCAPAVVAVTRMFSPRTRIVTEFNGLASELLLMSGYTRAVAGLAHYGYVRCARASHLVRALNRTSYDTLVARGVDSSRIVVAGTGANLELFRPTDRVAAMQAMGLDPAHRHITFVGYLSRWQGVDTLLRAAPLIRRLHPDVRFVIAGSGPQENNLKQYAIEAGLRDVVLFTGEIPYERVPVLINASELCIGPLITERSGQISRSPMKLREYAACGKPSITVREEGVKDLETAGATFLASSGDHEEVARLARHFLDDPDRCAAAGQQALRYAREHYSWKRVTDQILARMEEVPQ